MLEYGHPRILSERKIKRVLVDKYTQRFRKKTVAKQLGSSEYETYGSQGGHSEVKQLGAIAHRATQNMMK
jgi:hypothetical protein